MVGKVGLEPTMPRSHGFTVRCDNQLHSLTLKSIFKISLIKLIVNSILKINMVLGVGIEPTLHHLSGDCFTEV